MAQHELELGARPRVLTQQKVAACQLQARAVVGGHHRQVAFQRQQDFGDAPDLDCGHAVQKVEVQIAHQLRVGLRGDAGLLELASLDQPVQVVQRRWHRRFCTAAAQQAPSRRQAGGPAGGPAGDPSGNSSGGAVVGAASEAAGATPGELVVCGGDGSSGPTRGACAGIQGAWWVPPVPVRPAADGAGRVRRRSAAGVPGRAA